MSKWRVKGFVQDSDEEEEDIEISSASSTRDSQRSVDARDTDANTNLDDANERPETNVKSTLSKEENGPVYGATSPHSRVQDEGQRGYDEQTVVTQVVDDVPRSQNVTTPISNATQPNLKERSESPDPLLGSPTPKAERASEPFYSSQILGVPNISQGAVELDNNAIGNGKTNTALLPDWSDESDLSDPPSDLDELQPQENGAASPPRASTMRANLSDLLSDREDSPLQETVFASPTRRTTVQVVIPRSTTQEQQPRVRVFDRYVERSFRERKPIQLHPYLLEGERYRRDLQGRGVKPVTRFLSPLRKSRQNDQESQEQEFDPDKDLAPSSPLEITVSTPIVRRSAQSDQGSIGRRNQARSQNPRSTNLIHNGTKTRKLNQASRHGLTTPREPTAERNSSNADIWTVPQSPPYSSSPPINRSGSSAQYIVRRSTITPVPDLPTPSNSSSMPAPLDVDSDHELVGRSVQPSGQRAHQPILVSSDSSSSDTDASGGEAPASDHELRKVGKRIRGVLPASWLRLDLKAQEKRDRRMRERMNARSPEQEGPQRGVAQKVTKRQGTPSRVVRPNPLGNHIIELSDESDNDNNIPAPQNLEAQELAREAFKTAATLDRRYADDDSDTMENDRLHLFTLGGNRKRKLQTKLTDVFETSKRRKLAGKSGKDSKVHSSKQRSTLRKARRMPPPALSILDFDQSRSEREVVPQFLRIARRQARRRPDHARQSPTNKYIRLHTAQDTQDANVTLRDWKRGTIKPRANIVQPKDISAPRRPLADLDQNQQQAHRSSDAIIQYKEQSQLTIRKSRPTLIRRKEPDKARHTDEDHESSLPRSKQIHHINTNPIPFRTAQLERLETDHGNSNRRVAFEKGLQRVDRQFDLQLPLFQSSRNLQIARFLADDDIALSALPSVEHVEEHAPRSSIPNPPGPKRRLVRKHRAQRVDVETREYRQPSEPVVDCFLKSVPNLPVLERESGQGSQPTLQGLGPYGTRYSITFDVSPLQDGTYFHTSTFVGSGALHRALAATRDNTRSLDEPAGYCIVDFLGTSVRCGPWENSIVEHLEKSANNIWNPATNRSENDASQTSYGCSLDKISFIIRSLVQYVATHLSFHDPIDRKSFVSKTEQWATSIFESILSHSIADTDSKLQVKAGPLALLLVFCTQIHNIAQHPAVEQPVKSDLASLITSVCKSLVGDILDRVSDLSDFLENNKRYKFREDGIRDSEVIVESLVICMHTLSEASLPGIAFWELVGRSLSPAAKRATHLAEFESIWGTVFILLPFIEIDDFGILMRSRRTSFKEDNWAVIRALLQRVFALYSNTSTGNSVSLDDYVRAVTARCHELIHFWHWNRCEPVLYTMFDFFVAKNGLKHLRREQCNGSAAFLDQLDDGYFYHIEPNTRPFHIFLKCLYIGIQGMRSCYAEKKLRSVVLRLIPNHGRSHPKDQPLEVESLEALRNHHDILCTLYRASPLPCRPQLELIKNLVHHENSHREACRIGIRSWANLTEFQLSTNEPYGSVQPFAEWHREILMQTLKQYRLAKTEAEDYLKSGVFNNTEATSLMVRKTMEKNQDQVIAAMRDCIAGLLRAIRVRNSQLLLKEFLLDSGLVQLLELPHLQDQRLIAVIRDALSVIRAFASLPRHPPNENIVSEQSEESQDYGDSFELDDLMEIDQEAPQPDDILQTPLWHLLSNAFGAEISPDEKLLMECVDTWCVIARYQVSLGARSWTFYLDPFSQVSWQQLRRTEQTQKFGPYFMASILAYDLTAYSQHRLDFLNALLVSLVDRESMLRFQYRLLGAITRAAPDEPLLKNLPFFDSGNGSIDINHDTLRTRRLALISSILANMRDDFHDTIQGDLGRVAEVKGSYAAILRDLMNAMKNNYQQLGSGTTVVGAYVEFVQKVIQFLQQYTADVHPVLDFFTNSVAFPLPAADPTYVVGRLCGYAPKLSKPGTPKQLSVFVQTVAQQAATGGHQLYLVHQLQTALCMDETPPRDRNALREVLLQGIFPAYIEAAFTSAIGFIIAQPILQSLVLIIEAMLLDIKIYDSANVQAICDCLLSVSHAFIRSTEQLKENDGLFRQVHVLQAISLTFQIMTQIAALLEYICGRCSESPARPLVVEYFEQLALFIGETLHHLTPQMIPDYGGNVSYPQTKNTTLLSFSIEGLQSGIKANWSATDDRIYFGHGHAKREVLFDWGTIEEARTNLVISIQEFLVSASSAQNDQAGYAVLLERDEYLGELDV